MEEVELPCILPPVGVLPCQPVHVSTNLNAPSLSMTDSAGDFGDQTESIISLHSHRGHDKSYKLLTTFDTSAVSSHPSEVSLSALPHYS